MVEVDKIPSDQVNIGPCFALSIIVFVNHAFTFLLFLLTKPLSLSTHAVELPKYSQKLSCVKQPSHSYHMMNLNGPTKSQQDKV